MTAEERSTCAVLAAWLGAAGTLGPWSLLLDAAALAGWFWLPLTAGTRLALAAVLLLGLLQRGLQLRLVFDQRLFAALAEARIADPAQVDAGLQQLRLRTARPRPFTDRLAGARRLVRRQGLVVALQTLALVPVLALAVPA